MTKRTTRPVKHLPANLRQPSALERPTDRLGPLLQQHAARQIDDWQAAPLLRELAAASGGRTFDELVNRLSGAEGDLRDSLFWAIGVVGGPETLLRLWAIARTPHKSRTARLAALAAIERLHGPIDQAEIPDDLARAVAAEGQLSESEVMRRVGHAETAAGVEDALLPVLGLFVRAANPAQAHAIAIEDALRRRDRLGAAFLRALSALTLFPDGRSEARIAAASLAERGIKPVGAGVLDLLNEPSLVAYSAADPDNPAWLRILLGVRRQSGRLRPYLFRIDITDANSQVLDLEATADLAEQELREQYIQPSWLSGSPLRETTLATATATIRRGVEGTAARPENAPAAIVPYFPLIRRYAFGD